MSKLDATSPYPDGPRLLADIGGTKARFALETAPKCLSPISIIPCQAHATLQDAIKAYLHSPAGAAAGGEPFPSQPSPSPPRPPPLSDAPPRAAPAVMLGLETPVVVVRLPGKRPLARPWSQAEEARLTRVCQDCWPDVDCT